MKLKIECLENDIFIDEGIINVIEIENRVYFYKIVNSFNNLKNGIYTDEIRLYDNSNEEINLNNKLELLIDYFNINLNTKKNLNLIYKYITDNINDLINLELLKIDKKITSIFKKILTDIEIPIDINHDFNIDNYYKILSPSIKLHNSILDNLMLLIDMEEIFSFNKLLVFVNLKQYLIESELTEFYKYVLYNKVNIILIESNTCKNLNEYEKKLIIDNDLFECVI